MSDLLQPPGAVLGTGLSRSAGCTLQPVHKVSVELKVNICLALQGFITSCHPALTFLPSCKEDTDFQCLQVMLAQNVQPGPT